MSEQVPFGAAPGKPLKAAARRAALDEAQAGLPKEIGGPKGPDPTRYGDWDLKGRAIDF